MLQRQGLRREHRNSSEALALILRAMLQRQGIRDGEHRVGPPVHLTYRGSLKFAAVPALCPPKGQCEAGGTKSFVRWLAGVFRTLRSQGFGSVRLSMRCSWQCRRGPMKCAPGEEDRRVPPGEVQRAIPHTAYRTASELPGSLTTHEQGFPKPRERDTIAL